jgi:U3 small nucleolar RNA-associated protein 7
MVRDAVTNAARAEILLPEEVGYLQPDENQKTYQVSQEEIFKAVDLQTQTKMFHLDLNELGPYSLDYTKNGRHLLLGGKKGHLAMFDWQSKKLFCEVHVNELINDVK